MSVADPRIEFINKQTKLYRIGKLGTGQGLWYDSTGAETGIIHRKGLRAAALPMEPHPVFRYGGYRWISATDTLEGLGNWFTRDEMPALAADGYQLEVVAVSAYLRLHFETYSHEVYRDEDVLGRWTLDHMAPYKELETT